MRQNILRLSERPLLQTVWRVRLATERLESKHFRLDRLICADSFIGARGRFCISAGPELFPHRIRFVVSDSLWHHLGTAVDVASIIVSSCVSGSLDQAEETSS